MELQSETIEKLKSIAEPFVDTLDSVVLRLYEFYIANQKGIEQSEFTNGTRAYSIPVIQSKLANSHVAIVQDPEFHPSLVGAIFRGGYIGDVNVPPSEGWNGLMRAALNMAIKKMRTCDFEKILRVNYEKKIREDAGFKPLDNGQFSIQGQSASRAWSQTYRAIKAMKIEARIEFSFKNSKSINHIFEIN